MKKAKGDTQRRSPPARTMEGRENQLISLAIDLAEMQLRNGTAPPSVINHYLKLGSTREQLEMEKLRKENQLLRAKTDRIDSDMKMDVVYDQVLEALRSYSPSDEVIVDE